MECKLLVAQAEEVVLVNFIEGGLVFVVGWVFRFEVQLGPLFLDPFPAGKNGTLWGWRGWLIFIHGIVPWGLAGPSAGQTPDPDERHESIRKL